MGSHDQRDMPVPAVPGPHFVLIQAQLRLGFLKAAFDGPTGTGGQGQFGQGTGHGREGQIGGQTPFVQGAADQKIALADRLGRRVDRLASPFVLTGSLAARPCAEPRPRRSVGRWRGRPRRPAPRVVPHPARNKFYH